MKEFVIGRAEQTLKTCDMRAWAKPPTKIINRQEEVRIRRLGDIDAGTFTSLLENGSTDRLNLADLIPNAVILFVREISPWFGYNTLFRNYRSKETEENQETHYCYFFLSSSPTLFLYIADGFRSIVLNCYVEMGFVAVRLYFFGVLCSDFPSSFPSEPAGGAND